MQSTLCRRPRQFKMQQILTIAMFSGILVSGIQVREPENETEMPSTGSSALTAPEPTDNGMAVGEAPDTSPTPATGREFLNPSTEPPVDAVFPQNHKNFSASSYLGAIESPPFLNSYNKYKQQYKEYYAQKNQFATAKPIKFEEHTPDGNFGLGAYEEPSEKPRSRPYVFDALTTEQPAYSIPDNDFETTEETKDFTTSSPLFGFPFSALFGGKPKAPTFTQGQRSELAQKHKSVDPWKKVMKVLTTVIPFGLFLAALTPNLLYVNTTEENRPLRLRSLDNFVTTQVEKNIITDPLVDMVQRFGGLEAMEDPKCEDRFFCEMAVLGQRDDSNIVGKGFWYLANETPDDIAKEAGMKELFTAIRNKSCEVYKCESKPKVVKEQKPRKFKKVLKT